VTALVVRRQSVFSVTPGRNTQDCEPLCGPWYICGHPAQVCSGLTM